MPAVPAELAVFFHRRLSLKWPRHVSSGMLSPYHSISSLVVAVTIASIHYDSHDRMARLSWLNTKTEQYQ